MTAPRRNQPAPAAWEFEREDDDDRRGAQFPLKKTRSGWKPIEGAADRPMILVSWFGAAAYSLWAHGRDWRAFRDSESEFLPTEAQWELASTGVELSEAVTGRHRRGITYDSAIPSTSVNERRGMSAYGLHHMAGNVWHWCRDWYCEEFYKTSDSRIPNAWNRVPTGIRSERGGSWVGPSDLAARTYRRGRPPRAKGRCLGFRCVATESLPTGS